MVSAHFGGDGPWYPVRVGLGGLVVALALGFGVLTTPCCAWADPGDDTTAPAQSPSDDDSPADADDQQTSPDADGGSTENGPTVDSTPEGDSPSQSEITLGDGGPEVTIRYSGGYDADAPEATPQAPAEESTTAETSTADPAADTEQTPTVTPEAPSTVAPQPVTDAVVEGEQQARVADPDVLEPLRLEPFDSRINLDTPPSQAAAPRSVAAGAGPATTTTTETLSAPLIAGPPFPEFGELFTEPDGLLTAASALFSGVLNMLLEPTPGSRPPDSPIVWAVLGLVRRQLTGGAAANPLADPWQTSRDPDDEPETFTAVTGGRYAYVVDRGSDSVTVVDVDTHEVVEVPVARDQLVSTPVLSPDGSRLFVTRAHNGGVYAIDTVLGSTVDIDDATAQSEPIIAGEYLGPNDYYVPDGGLAFSPDGTLLYISRQHAQIVGGLFMPADGDVVVVGNDPSDPATYLQVIGGPIDVEA